MTLTVQPWNLTKVYERDHEQVYALNDISLEIYPGEMVAIVEREGSGTFTLLHTPVPLQDVGPEQAASHSRERVRPLKVGLFSHAFNLLPDETALDNVAAAVEGPGLEGWERRQKAEKALELVGLEYRLRRKPAQLSIGQRLCVGLARTLVNDPDVIFADDPTRALDSTSRDALMGLFQKLNDAGMTIVMYTTDSSVASYCRRMVRVEEGRAAADEVLSDRLVIPPSRMPGLSRAGEDAEERKGAEEGDEEVACPRCNLRNPADEQVCQRCSFVLYVITEEGRRRRCRSQGNYLGGNRGHLRIGPDRGTEVRPLLCRPGLQQPRQDTSTQST